jgi:TolB-like protein/class 3 adenylate cyclase
MLANDRATEKSAMERTVRKLAAILVADVVGYSRMIEADEAATLSAMRVIRATIGPLLEQHAGRAIKTTGDGFIAEFASIVDAIGFAVLMQKAAATEQTGVAPDRRLVFRIGLNVGDVVVENDDLLGDGVNIAARLEQICDPGGILISGTAYDQLDGKFDLPIDFAGNQQVKNISRPVRTYRVRLEGSGPAWYYRYWRRRTAWRALAVAGFVVAAAAAALWWSNRQGALTANPSIAIVPFENLGSDPASDRLAQGITADIVTDFSRFGDIDVIASSASEAYRNTGADTRQIARDLNVRYILKGSIQREGDQIRVNAQLFDGATGTSLWSNRWDRPAADIFAIQTDVADHVISSLGGTNFLARQSASAARRKSPADLDAYDLYALAVAAYQKGTRAGFADAARLANEAIAKDPLLVRAYVIKGWAVRRLEIVGSREWQQSLRLSASLARKAIEIDPNEADAYILLGENLRQLGVAAEQARPEIDRALELNPSSADVMMSAASNLAYLGRAPDGAKLCDRAFHLNPLPPPWYPGNCIAAYFLTGRYRDALAMINRQTEWLGQAPNLLAWGVAIQTELGNSDAASASVTTWKSRYPNTTVEELVSFYWGFSSTDDRDRVVASLVKAGAPICVPADRIESMSDLKHLAFCDRQRGSP